MRMRAAVLTTALLLAPGGAALACAFHPNFADGLSVAYPGSLRVAVAVADARREALLPPAGSRRAATGAVCLVSLVAERRTSPLQPVRQGASSSGESCAYAAALLRLQDLGRRLEASADSEAGESGAEFSLVLVGPRLWSHYRLTDSRVMAQHHVDGPLTERAVVLTDDAVLEALLDGKLEAQQAVDAGLISVAGPDGEHIARLLARALAHG